MFYVRIYLDSYLKRGSLELLFLNACLSLKDMCKCDSELKKNHKTEVILWMYKILTSFYALSLPHLKKQMQLLKKAGLHTEESTSFSKGKYHNKLN